MRLILLSVLAAGCSSILGFGEPRHREDAGVAPDGDAAIDAGLDASADASVDAGVDAAISAAHGFIDTAGATMSFTGGFTLHTACASNGICANGGFTR